MIITVTDNNNKSELPKQKNNKYASHLHISHILHMQHEHYSHHTSSPKATRTSSTLITHQREQVSVHLNISQLYLMCSYRAPTPICLSTSDTHRVPQHTCTWPPPFVVTLPTPVLTPDAQH